MHVPIKYECIPLFNSQSRTHVLRWSCPVNFSGISSFFGDMVGILNLFNAKEKNYIN